MREAGGKSLAVNGVSDHAHLLITLPSATPVADAVRLVKSNSSKWLNEQNATRARFGWQSGYAAFSVSQSSVSEVLNYIAGQESHHRKATFRDEYISFLQKHGIEYDERYLWE